jgi:hypothetical protein
VVQGPKGDTFRLSRATIKKGRRLFLEDCRRCALSAMALALPSLWGNGGSSGGAVARGLIRLLCRVPLSNAYHCWRRIWQTHGGRWQSCSGVRRRRLMLVVVCFRLITDMCTKRYKQRYAFQNANLKTCVPKCTI